MLNIVVGKIYCENCEIECSKLWGSRISLRSAPADKNTFQEINNIEKEYGKKDFYLCMRCALGLMGVKSLAEKKAESEKQKQDIAKPQEQNPITVIPLPVSSISEIVEQKSPETIAPEFTPMNTINSGTISYDSTEDDSKKKL